MKKVSTRLTKLISHSEKQQKNTPALSALTLAMRASVLSLGLVAGNSHAATIVVDSNLDDGTNCTLREAVTTLNNGNLAEGCSNTGDVFGTNDTINFADTLNNNLNRTITLSGGQLEVTSSSNITIDATSKDDGITLDANRFSRVISVTSATLSINNMTLQNGLESVYGNGGGIFSDNSDITLTNSQVSGNRTSRYFGGGIQAFSNSSVTLINSTVSGNSAGFGGGGINVVDSSVTLINSTVSGNSASLGGGIYTYGNGTSLSLINSTVSGNNASGAGLQANYGSVISLENSTVAENIGSNGSLFAANESSIRLTNSIVANSLDFDDCLVANNGTVTSDPASIIEDGSCASGARAFDPGLLPLTNNGGLTQTHALQENSLARNSGDLDSCALEDQRGQVRNDGDGLCDVGAIEFNEDDLSAIDEEGFIVIPLGNDKVVVVPL